MNITVVHGDTQIQISGAKSLKTAKKTIKDIFKMLPDSSVVSEEEEPNPIGFSVGASIERAEETVEYIYDDDEE